jgi:hypothetical protein
MLIFSQVSKKKLCVTHKYKKTERYLFRVESAETKTARAGAARAAGNIK